MKPGAIYDIVVTQPISLEGVSIEAVDHRKCISGACRGMDRNKARRKLASIAKDEVYYWPFEDEKYRELCRRFPILDGAEIELYDPESND